MISCHRCPAGKDTVLCAVEFARSGCTKKLDCETGYVMKKTPQAVRVRRAENKKKTA